MLRRLWQRWRDRHIIHGRHFDVRIVGRWWSPSERRAAAMTVHTADCFADEFKTEPFSVTRKHFTPDEWPFADEDPPDPL